MKRKGGSGENNALKMPGPLAVKPGDVVVYSAAFIRNCLGGFDSGFRGVVVDSEGPWVAVDEGRGGTPRLIRSEALAFPGSARSVA